MQCVLEELSLAPLPSRLADPVLVRTVPTPDGAVQVRVAPPVGERLPFVESVGLALSADDDEIELKTAQQPFTLVLPPAKLQKASLNLVLYLQKWCTRPAWPLLLEVPTKEATERNELVEFYCKPFNAPRGEARPRSRDIVVAAVDDPERVFKRKRKATE